VLPTEPLTAKQSDWDEAPKVHRAYGPVIKRINLLRNHGLMAMMVLDDFRSRRIAFGITPARLGCILEKATPRSWSTVVIQIWPQTCWAPC
jgi:hypothetical protein